MANSYSDWPVGNSLTTAWLLSTATVTPFTSWPGSRCSHSPSMRYITKVVVGRKAPSPKWSGVPHVSVAWSWAVIVPSCAPTASHTWSANHTSKDSDHGDAWPYWVARTLMRTCSPRVHDGCG